MPYTYKYPRPAVTVDAVVFRKGVTGDEVLLIRRGHPPFEGKWALPGGFVDMDETLEEAVKRELKEETGLELNNLRQVKAYSAVDRDPRHRTISIAFTGWAGNSQNAVAGDDASQAAWFPVNNLPPLAFDHDEIIKDGYRKVRKIY